MTIASRPQLPLGMALVDANNRITTAWAYYLTGISLQLPPPGQAGYNSASVNITGGTINGTQIGNSVPSTGVFSLISGPGTGITGTANGLASGSSNNLTGGSGGSIPYQSSTGTTSMLANGTAGQVLSSQGTTLTPIWSNLSSLVAVPVQTVLTSGSGTFNVPTGAKYITVEMTGAGGGGAGSGVGSTSGSNGNNTTFGTSLLTCTGGIGGVAGNSAGSVGGTATINSPAVGINYPGASGRPVLHTSIDSYAFSSNAGVNYPNIINGDGQTGYGMGGSGGGILSTINSVGGAAGGNGAYIKAMITILSSTYLYSVGSGGTPGTLGTSGFYGQKGEPGLIIVSVYFI